MSGEYLDGPLPGTQTLGEDDPLRAWAAQNIDPVTGALIATNPSQAIEAMIAKGIAPPPPVMAYTDGMAADNQYPMPMGGRNPTLPTQVIGGAAPETPYPQGGDPMKGTGTPDKRSLIQRGVEALGGAFPIIGPNGKMMGNLTSLQGQPNAVPAPEPSPRLTREDNIPSGAALDPVPEAVVDRVPLPRARPTEAGTGASDISAQSKKPAAADALGDFSKSLAGIKPIQPAPVNPVGTPAVRAPHATGAPNIQSLLQMIGQQNSPTVLSTLGRLLVAGKA